MLEQIYNIAEGVLYWLEGYLVLLTIASTKPLFPKLYNQHNEEIIDENTHTQGKKQIKSF